MGNVRVLMIVANLRVANGVSSFVMNYYRKVKKEHICIDFALYSDIPSPYYDEIQANGGKIMILPSIKHLKKHVSACQKLLKDGNYDVIHNNILHISIPMMWCAKQANIPVRILHSHNAKMGETTKKEIRNRAFLPVLRGLATDYTACSELAGKAMFGERPFAVIPNVIAAEHYRFREESRQRLHRQMNAEGKCIIGTVGRLAEQKNPLFAVDVFKKLLEQVPNAEYWWIGSGNLDQRVKEYVEASGMSDHIKLLGSRNDVIDLYQAMDCFFLPSLFEGLPVTGVEAQAMGLPMVVSDTVTDEMVYTDLVDYVSLNAPVDEWAAHLERALNRRDNRESYSEQLKQSIFSDTGCGERLENLYTELLRKRGGM